MNQTVTRLEETFPQAVQVIHRFGELTVVVERALLVDVCTLLRDDPALAFNTMCDLSAVDKWPKSPRFEVNLHLLSLPAHPPTPGARRLRVQVRLEEHDARMPTLSGVWPSTAWYERESHDLLGIDFEAHPDPRPLLLPAGWDSASPLRRDIPTPLEEVAFSFSQERVYHDKPVAQKHPTMADEIGAAPETALPLEKVKHLVTPRALTGETALLNLGPQQPGPHGLSSWGLLLELDGENILTCIPDVGYLHSGIEKSCERKTYTQIIPLAERMDYLSPLSTNLGYVMAVEKLLAEEIPMRAQYVRVILAELARIASHLTWLGASSFNLGALSVFFYSLREREQILDIFELCSGQRMMTGYLRVGGLWRDVPEDFELAVRQFLAYMPDRIREYERLLKENPIWKKRTLGVGVISAEQAIAWSLGGPCLRACGVDWDLRRVAPYSCYEHFEFDVPLGDNGDVYDRYRCRVLELWSSLRIIEQALDQLPGGPVMTPNRKVAPPPKEELAYSMQALIHHFKLWTEGFCPPKGQVYHAIESPRGELGIYINSDGSGKPRRVHFRTPSFAHLQALSWVAKGSLVSDLTTITDSLDLVVGEVDR